MVPSFLDTNSTGTGSSRLLQKSDGITTKINLKNLDVNKDIVEVSFYLNSAVDADTIKFSLELISWTSKELKLYINFTNPALIS